MTDWETIVDKYAPDVWRVAQRLVGNRADAWDCVQEAFLEAVKIDRRESVREWPGLLRHLVTLRALDLLRRRVRHRSRCGEEVDSSLAVSREPSPPLRAEASELADRLRAALTQLPRRQAQVFCLACLEGMTCEQVAGQMGIGSAAVRMLLCRARRRLRRILMPLDHLPAEAD